MECPNQTTDPRVKRTRALLQNALRDLLRERAISDISVLDIAERATVNRATFYAHFDDKQAIMTSVLRDDLHQAFQAQFPECPDFNRANVLKVAIVVYKFLYSLRSNCPATAREITGPLSSAVQETVFDMMMYWSKHHPPVGIPDGYTVESLATVLSWSIFGGASQWAQSDRKTTAEKHASGLLDLIFREAA
ncbi:MAG: TetR family transcriptional regulator [Armatimonadetes bacterium]|nr:TetR family transcriptional regulator [Armatimonadota bacterium]